MATIAAVIKLHGESPEPKLQEVLDTLDAANGEVVLDFSSVKRVCPADLAILETLAAKAQATATRVVLCGVNVKVYKVLKLARLTSQFQFAN